MKFDVTSHTLTPNYDHKEAHVVLECTAPKPTDTNG